MGRYVHMCIIVAQWDAICSGDGKNLACIILSTFDRFKSKTALFYIFTIIKIRWRRSQPFCSCEGHTPRLVIIFSICHFLTHFHPLRLVVLWLNWFLDRSVKLNVLYHLAAAAAGVKVGVEAEPSFIYFPQCNNGDEIN